MSTQFWVNETSAVIKTKKDVALWREARAIPDVEGEEPAVLGPRDVQEAKAMAYSFSGCCFFES